MTQAIVDLPCDRGVAVSFCFQALHETNRLLLLSVFLTAAIHERIAKGYASAASALHPREFGAHRALARDAFFRAGQKLKQGPDIVAAWHHQYVVAPGHDVQRNAGTLKKFDGCHGIGRTTKYLLHIGRDNHISPLHAFQHLLVTDFELSVRSRNCLPKMNIRTLGDLIMKSEQELLAYKNFGETSLDEIKNMLDQKGLRLGQGLEDGGSEPTHGRNPLEATTDSTTLDKSSDDLELSVRSRRCMERLGIRSVRDLINKTEIELIAAKNFGMTSLNEIKRKLKELGLDLRS